MLHPATSKCDKKELVLILFQMFSNKLNISDVFIKQKFEAVVWNQQIGPEQSSNISTV